MNISDKVRNCNACPMRSNLPECCTPVPGIGNGHKLMMIAESVNETDVMVGEPFMCKNGQLLYRIIKDSDIPLDDVYLTNLVKCNGKVTKKVITKCGNWLKEEIGEIQPEYIILFGKKVAEYFSLDYEDSLFKLQGKYYTCPSLHTLLMGSNKNLIQTRKGLKEIYGLCKK